MKYGEIKVIGEQIFFDRIAIADIRGDALPTSKENFKAKIIKADAIINENTLEVEEEQFSQGHDSGYTSGYDIGYEEGYSDALANKSLEQDS